MARNSNASYESDDNRRVPLSGVDTSLNYKDFATLDDFVRATNGTVLQVNRGCSFAFRDTGGWCPRKTANYWYRCLIVRYQNSIASQLNVYGTVLVSDGFSLYIGYITGTTSFSISWFSVIEYGQNTMWEALPATIVMANGHFTASPAGWVALTSHGSDNDLVNRWRLQLGQDSQGGVVQVYKSTDSGASWQHVSNILRADQISTWTVKTLASNTTYVSSQGSYTKCYYNSAIKLASLHMNLNITTQVPPNHIILGGLPKPFHNIGASAGAAGKADTGGGNGCRLYVRTDGGIYADQLIPTGWFNGSVTYPYSSL